MKLYTKISIGLVAGAVVGVGVNLLEWEQGAAVVRALEPLGTAFIRAIIAPRTAALVVPDSIGLDGTTADAVNSVDAPSHTDYFSVRKLQRNRIRCVQGRAVTVRR